MKNTITGSVTELLKPSTPSVRFTALTQPTMTNMAKKIYTMGCRSKRTLKNGMYRWVSMTPERYMAYKNTADTAICSMAFCKEVSPKF